jgi:hypothetical protein
MPGRSRSATLAPLASRSGRSESVHQGELGIVIEPGWQAQRFGAVVAEDDEISDVDVHWVAALVPNRCLDLQGAGARREPVGHLTAHRHERGLGSSERKDVVIVVLMPREADLERTGYRFFDGEVLDLQRQVVDDWPELIQAVKEGVSRF